MSELLTKRWARFAFGAWLPVLLVALWWVASANSTNPYFPPLSQIVQVTWDTWVGPNASLHVLPSLRNMLIGLACGLTLGVLLGAHLALSKTATAFVLPIVDFLRSIPSIALIPVFIMFFGLEAQMRLAVITFVVTFPVLLSTLQAVRSTDPTLLDTVKVFKFSPFQILWKVRLPSALPQMFAGFQLALLISFTVTIGSELLGAGFGLGVFTKTAQDGFDIQATWAATIIMGLIGYVLFVIFEVVERFSLRWYYGAKKLEK